MNQDEEIHKVLSSSASNIEHNGEPTVLSLADTTAWMKIKFGDNWLENPLAEMFVIHQSSIFIESDVKETCEKDCPQLLDFCMEYRTRGTVNGKKMPPDMWKVYHFWAIEEVEKIQEVERNYKIVGFSPIKDAYFKIET